MLFTEKFYLKLASGYQKLCPPPAWTIILSTMVRRLFTFVTKSIPKNPNDGEDPYPLLSPTIWRKYMYNLNNYSPTLIPHTFNNFFVLSHSFVSPCFPLSMHKDQMSRILKTHSPLILRSTRKSYAVDAHGI